MVFYTIMSISRRKVLCLVAVAGALVKLAELLVWRESYFRFYHLVPGLDMETLLRFGEWGEKGNGFFFTPHRALIAAWWALKGHSHYVTGIVAVQSLFGIMGAVLCADLALKLFDRDRIAALACGLFYLLYGPFFIYEFSVLQEAVSLNLILLAFHAAVSARGRRGFVWAGTALGLCVVGRPTALFFVPLMLGFMAYRELKARRRPWKSAAKKLLPALAGAFAVLCLVSIANRTFGGNWSCFFDVMPYSLEYNAGAGGGPAPGNPYCLMLVNAVKRAPQMFMPTEIPENLNYCFLCRKMPFLNALPGPGTLLPLALAGMLLLIPKLRRPAALALLPILALVLPLCVREPIGRYRLTMIPYFILCAGYWVHFAKSKPWKLKVPVAAGAAAACLALLLPTYRSDLLRSDDYLAWAIAANPGKPNGEALPILAEGWEKGGFRNNKLGLMLYRQLEELSEGEKAFKVLVIGAQNSPENDIYLYYLAFRFANMGNFAAAEQVLSRTDPGKLGELAGSYHFLYAEMLRLRGEKTKAAEHYRRVVALLDPQTNYAVISRKYLSEFVPAPDAAGASGTTPPPPAAPSRE